MINVVFNPKIEEFKDRKKVILNLRLSIQLGVLALSHGNKRKNGCQVSLKNKNGQSSCKLEGDVDSIINKLSSIVESSQKREQFALINDCGIVFTVPSNLHKILVGEKCADGIRSQLKLAFHVFPTTDSNKINVSLKGRLDRLMQVYGGIFRLVRIYGGTEKFVINDTLFKTIHVGKVPISAIPSPLLHQHKNMQTESGAKITYGSEIVNNSKLATVSGFVWQVENAVKLICSSLEKKKIPKKHVNSYKTRAFNPEMDEDSAIVYVPQDVVGHIIGKDGQNIKQLVTTFNVTVKFEDAQFEEETMKKIIVSAKPNEHESSVYNAVWWIYAIVRKMAKKPIPNTKEEKQPTTFKCAICWDTNEKRNGISCVDFEHKNESDAIHTLCHECVQQFANEASNPVSETPIANGGIGLCCPDIECNNVILLSNIRWVLGDKILKKLEKRCMDECIRLAGLEGLVTCMGCDNMLIVEGGSDFKCPECNRRQCRECDREYSEQHFAKTCDQVTQEEERERRQAIARGEAKKIHDEMSELMIRKCPGCKTPMTKLLGCNKMTCARCQTKFCYICCARDIDYNHFGHGCELFAEFNDMDGLLLQPYERQLAELQLVY